VLPMNMTSRRGYVVALLVLLGGGAVLGVMMWRLSTQVDKLTRIPVPGTSEITLPAGESIGYGEPAEGSVGDVSFAAQCNAVAQDGSKVELGSPTAKVSYQLGSRQGVSILSIKMASAGNVTITCTADAAFTLAIGGGVGTSIVIGVVAMLFGVILAIVMFVRTWRRRKRERRSATTASSSR
jgi:hypothetical protein